MKDKLDNFMHKFRYRIYPAARAAFKVLQGYITKKRMPIFVSLFVTQRCNLKCTYCFPDSPHRKEGDIPIDRLFKIIDDLCGIGARYITILGGEPTLRDDFDKIVDYIAGKGILVDMSTNGCLIKRWQKTIKKLFLICNSIDGDEEAHDLNRGKGSFEKIMESIEFCRANNVPIQLRSVITPNNINHIQFMLDLSKKLGTTLSLGEQCVDCGQKVDRATAERYRQFWQFMKQKKNEGYLIDKSDTCIDQIINYPTDVPMDRIFMEGDKDLDKFSHIPRCTIRNGFLFVDENGMMYPCVPLFGKWGKNYNELGIKRAWEELTEYKCVFCRSSIYDMKSYFFGAEGSTMFDVFCYMANKVMQQFRKKI